MPSEYRCEQCQRAYETMNKLSRHQTKAKHEGRIIDGRKLVLVTPAVVAGGPYREWERPKV